MGGGGSERKIEGKSKEIKTKVTNYTFCARRPGSVGRLIRCYVAKVGPRSRGGLKRGAGRPSPYRVLQIVESLPPLAAGVASAY